MMWLSVFTSFGLIFFVVGAVGVWLTKDDPRADTEPDLSIQTAAAGVVLLLPAAVYLTFIPVFRFFEWVSK